ncbi:hypothetical protein [Bradyrhizobium altum]|uniref:hypothetical protein n=1 Tax=Bradyrhizobium altum TaxID=1571202 RepID=UPI001E5DFCA0|nr:hypothetical protein [Bradyrhizobium altum]
MAIALGGRPEDNAKMVWSRGCIAYFFQQIGKGNAAPISHAMPQYVAMQHNQSLCDERAAILLHYRRPDHSLYGIR